MSTNLINKGQGFTGKLTTGVALWGSIQTGSSWIIIYEPWVSLSMSLDIGFCAGKGEE